MKDAPSTKRKTWLLSSKKRWVDPSCSGNRNNAMVGTDRSSHSSAEIWRWTLTKSATAPCFVRDVHEMQESGSREHDFFWLNKVPCRTVKLLGVIVGVQTYEKRVVYTLDDGTSTIDCVHRPEPPPAPLSPAKPKSTSKGKEKSNPYIRPPSPKADKKERIVLLPEPLAPVAGVGATVRVIGRVLTKHNSRQIQADHIDICLSANDEIHHWSQVLALHKEKYSQSGPFLIPVSTISAASPEEAPSITQELHSSNYTPQTPSRRLVVPHSTPSTVSSVSGSSPVKSEYEDQTQPRLRHPSRLHSRDLNLNTFRIYVKHYMDNAPAPAVDLHNCLVCGPSEYCPHFDSSSSATAGLRQHSFHIPTTPMNSSALNDIGVGEKTPRTSMAGNRGEDATPRAPRYGVLPEQSERQKLCGFTMSYLRRVPELRLMARRTVEAEAKRRRHQERHDAKQSASRSTQLRRRPENVVGDSRREELRGDRKRSGGGEPVGRKMKRLFSVTILKLYEEGSIVLWDGPVRPFSSLRYGSQSGPNQSQAIWKSTSAASMALSAISTAHSASIGAVGGDDVDGDVDDRDSDLSDVPLNEEAYVPVTPGLLAEYVEAAIKTLMERSSRELQPSRSTCKQLSAAYRPRAVATPGPTTEEIVRFLRRGDEMWAKVGEWAIEDALQLLRKEGRAWDIGQGRWELCL
ncbi:hypothetical protein NEOLEDRAFT_1114146 [Neolentinus lepideus HHB14362 ss-1]|uniref:CST complex subunit STN1 n=1 Tax=Neolentinus lepideus HHB14362 ss-1 TaxID=1314782 RepID=A0A165SVX8_9AGAM|nr:hypothetical protein NEOLEDRAFT_1114146 [Neolentinus lepideus HHB14362 ss-1]